MLVNQCASRRAALQSSTIKAHLLQVHLHVSGQTNTHNPCLCYSQQSNRTLRAALPKAFRSESSNVGSPRLAELSLGKDADRQTEGSTQEEQTTGRQHNFYATCHPGLEQMVANELFALGLTDVHTGTAGVSFKCGVRDALRANLWLRCAVRVLMRLRAAPMTTDLERGVRGGQAVYDFVKTAAPWHKVIPSGCTFSIEVRMWGCTDLNNSALAWTRAKDAICDVLRDNRDDKPPPPAPGQRADVPLYLTLFNDDAQIFRDMSGDSLHRRGYRDVMHKAALNEAAAAGILALAGWPGEWAKGGGVTLADPMCGSGTLLIEAALAARNIAPGTLRGRDAWPFVRWPDYKEQLWRDVWQEAVDARRPWHGQLAGNDAHEGALSLARRQARAAGVEDCISFTLGDAAPWRPSALDADTYTDIFTASSSSSSSKPTTTTTTTASAALPMLVVTNPPWGMRLGREEESAYPPQRSARERDRGRPAGGPKGIAALDEPTIMSWRALDQFLYHGCPGSTAYVVSGNKDAFKALKLKHSAKHALTVGGVDVSVAKYELRPRTEKAVPLDVHADAE